MFCFPGYHTYEIAHYYGETHGIDYVRHRLSKQMTYNCREALLKENVKQITDFYAIIYWISYY